MHGGDFNGHDLEKRSFIYEFKNISSLIFDKYTKYIILYSTAQEKSNRERERERVQNGCENVMGTEPIQNRFRTDTEQ